MRCIDYYHRNKKPKKLYHGTSGENAERILREGFKKTVSEQAILGFGVYFKCNPKDAKIYGDTVIEVTMPDNYEWEEAVPFQLFDDWVESERDWKQEQFVRGELNISEEELDEMLYDMDYMWEKYVDDMEQMNPTPPVGIDLEGGNQVVIGDDGIIDEINKTLKVYADGEQ